MPFSSGYFTVFLEELLRKTVEPFLRKLENVRKFFNEAPEIKIIFFKNCRFSILVRSIKEC